jgi:hypothetical protein
MNIQQRESLVAEAETSFLIVVQQVDHLVDLIHFFMSRYLAETLSLEHKHDWLNQSLQLIAARLKELGDVVVVWKTGQPRLMTRLGVELSILNELYLTVKTTAGFLLREGLDLHPFNPYKFNLAWTLLLQANRVLP